MMKYHYSIHWSLPVAALIGLLLVVLSSGIPTVHAQQTLGSICIDAFTDNNQNGVHDTSESALPNITASLMVDSNIVINNMIIDGKSDQPSCFRGLAAGAYFVRLSSPLTNTTTDNLFPVNLKSGDQVTVPFGGNPAAQTTLDPNKITIVLTRNVRLGMAIAGAFLVMFAMTVFRLFVQNLYLLLMRE